MSEGEFHRAQILLHPEDVEILKRTYGYGWSAKIRDIVHVHAQNLKGLPPPPQTLGDLLSRLEESPDYND